MKSGLTPLYDNVVVQLGINPEQITKRITAKQTASRPARSSKPANRRSRSKRKRRA